MFRFLNGDPTGLLQMRIYADAGPTRPTTPTLCARKP